MMVGVKVSVRAVSTGLDSTRHVIWKWLCWGLKIGTKVATDAF